MEHTSDAKPVLRRITTASGTGHKRRIKRLKVDARPKPVRGIIWASQIRSEPVQWLWDGRIQLARFGEFIGDPYTGKSTVALDLAARISRGDAMPDGTRTSVSGKVLVLKCEDGDTDVKGRLEAMSADLHKVAIIDEDLTFPKDAERLRELIRTTQAVLVIIDGLATFLGGIGDGGADSLVRKAVRPLMNIADEEQVTIVAIRHLVKGNKSRAVYAGNGSIAYSAVARSSLVFASDPHGGDGDFVMASVGTNFGKPVPALTYSIAEHANSYTRIDWTGEAATTADELVSAKPRKTRPRDTAMDFLKRELAGGPVDATALAERAAQAGITEHTLRRAADELRVIRRQSRVSGGRVGQSTWVLPKPPVAHFHV
jgi:hypothetical protein